MNFSASDSGVCGSGHGYLITRHLHIDHLKGPCFNRELEWKAFMTTLLTLISDLEI